MKARKSRRAASARRWREKNSDHVRQYQRERYAKRRDASQPVAVDDAPSPVAGKDEAKQQLLDAFLRSPATHQRERYAKRRDLTVDQNATASMVVLS